MVRIIRRKATSKRSLINALRANQTPFKSVKTVKRAGKTTVGTYKIVLRKKR